MPVIAPSKPEPVKILESDAALIQCGEHKDRGDTADSMLLPESLNF